MVYKDIKEMYKKDIYLYRETLYIVYGNMNNCGDILRQLEQEDRQSYFRKG